jgi:hypothetical protein
MMATTWRSFSPSACDEMLWSARSPPVELAGVLLREEALGRGAEQVDVEADHATRMKSTSQRLAQRPVEARLVPREDAGEAGLRPAREPPGRLFRGSSRAAQQPGAHHRRGGERDHERDQHRRRERDRELAEQAPDLALP